MKRFLLILILVAGTLSATNVFGGETRNLETPPQPSPQGRGHIDPVVIASRKHDLNVIQIYDRRDEELPDVGLLKIRDAESGERVWVDTSLASTRNAYAEAWQTQQAALETLFSKTGINHVSMRTDEDYVKKLMMLFHN